jgi:hypothetical protein
MQGFAQLPLRPFLWTVSPTIFYTQLPETET